MILERGGSCGAVQEIAFARGADDLVARVVIGPDADESMIADAYRILNGARY